MRHRHRPAAPAGGFGGDFGPGAFIAFRRVTTVRLRATGGAGRVTGTGNRQRAEARTGHDDGWLVLSDRNPDGPLPAMVERGIFVAELALPLESRALLMEFGSLDGWERGLSLYYDPEAGLMIRHRQGRGLVRHLLPGALPGLQGIGRLSLHFDAPARHWSMRFEMIDDPEAPVLRSRGANPLPMLPSDVAALSEAPARLGRHPAVLWFGLTRGDDLPARAPWIGLRSPVMTARGPVAAGLLQPGELVETADNGFQPLLALQPYALPACGSFAPVLLRAPYFPVQSDLLVSSDQMVALEGPEVEYLFGEDEVLVPAGALVDGQSAMAEQRRAVTPSVMLVFERPELIIADGCALLAALPNDPPPRRCLELYEALTLMALLGRGAHRRRA